MHRPPIVRTASWTILFVGLAAAGGRPWARASQRQNHAGQIEDAQSPAAFEAEDVTVEERDEANVQRRIRAKRAMVQGDLLVGEQVQVEVPASPRGARPAWSLQTAWLHRALDGDRARLGPLVVTTTAGDRIEAQGGDYDGAQRQLTLWGPLSVCQECAEAHAMQATITFFETSAEMSTLSLEGDVAGHFALAPPLK